MASATRKVTMPRNINSQATLTRPANVNPYTANDVVGPTVAAVLTFSDMASVKQYGGKIHAATLTKDQATSTAADFDLVLFDTAPTPIADAAPFAMTAAERLAYVGFIRFVNTDAGVESNGRFWCHSGLWLPYVCAEGDTNLYGVLVVRDTYTPSSGELLDITLYATQD